MEAFFAESKDKARLDERKLREDRVRAWLDGSEEAAYSVEAWSHEIRDQHSPFHWWLEFPEVFYKERPDPLAGRVETGTADMDGFVGNPPFANTSTISASSGKEYFKWLTTAFPGDTGVRGKCDLCAFFFRRACQLLGDYGCLGMIATNTISQGDTRSIGLKHILADGFKIHLGVPNMVWPGDAAVTVSLVGLLREKSGSTTSVEFDGRAVGFHQLTVATEARATRPCEAVGKREGLLQRFDAVWARVRADSFRTRSCCRAQPTLRATVRLDRDPAGDDQDADGRLLRYVVLASGENVNATLSAKGTPGPFVRSRSPGVRNFYSWKPRPGAPGGGYGPT